MATDSQSYQKMDASAFADQVAKELNTISWTEIPATDFARVQTFYGKVFGWQFDNFFGISENCPEQSSKEATDKNSTSKSQDPVFVMFRFNETDPVPHGGFTKVTSENLLSPALHPDNEKKTRSSVCCTITVRDCAETLKKVVEAGGEVYVEKTMIPNGMGARAHFLDTEKNVMGLWSEK